MARVVWTPEAELRLLGLPIAEAEAVLDAVEEFASTGRGFVRKMPDAAELRGLYVGGYAVLFTLDEGGTVTGWGSPQCALIDELACPTTCQGPLCVDLQTDPNNCGMCKNSCTNIPLSQGEATGACVQGQCPVVSVGIQSEGIEQGPQYCVVGKAFPAGHKIQVDFLDLSAGAESPSCTTTVGNDGKLACDGTGSTTIFCSGCSFGDPSVIVTDVDANAVFGPVSVIACYWCNPAGLQLPPFGNAVGVPSNLRLVDACPQIEQSL